MRFCLHVALAAAVSGALSAASLAPSEPGASTAGPVWVVKVDARTGRLVRTLVAPKPSAAAQADLHGLAAEAAKDFDVNPLLVDSVIQVESNYNPFAVSPKGAQGLMQLMPGTAQRFGVTDSFDARQNIQAGVQYLKLLQNTFQDDRLAIAAYNAGENAVAKYKDVPPYPETVSYVAKVGKRYGQAKRADIEKVKRDSSKAKPASVAGSDSANETRHILAYEDSDGKLHLATQ